MDLLAGSPIAFETRLGWVLAGSTVPHTEELNSLPSPPCFILCKFWELEEQPTTKPALNSEEHSVMQQFEEQHHRSGNGRFIVPLPRRLDAKPLGESHSQAFRRFLSLEHFLRAKGKFSEFEEVMEEYIKLGHAELVPESDLQKPPETVFYLPVRKETSTYHQASHCI